MAEKGHLNQSAINKKEENRGYVWSDDYYGPLIAQHFITDLLLIIQKFSLKARFFNYLVTFVKIDLTAKAPSQ